MAIRAVWKFPLTSILSEVEMPVGAELLHLALQGDTPTLWALVDTEAPKELRVFRMMGTGHPWEEQNTFEMRYVGTVQFPDGIVGHYWEGISKGAATDDA